MIIQPDQINNLFATLNDIENLEEYISNSDYPNTLKAIWNLTLINNEIYQDIETCSSAHTTNCLLRVSLECFLVQYYIYHRLISDKNDSPGTEYYQNYRVAEFLKRENYNFRIRKILEGNSSKLSFDDLKTDLAPKIDSISLKEYGSLNSIKNKFDIVKIQKHILANPIEGNHLDSSNRNFIPSFLYVYNELCSYIHSGPSAALNIYKINSKRLDETRLVMWITITNLFFSLHFADEKFYYLLDVIKTNRNAT